MLSASPPMVSSPVCPTSPSSGIAGAAAAGFAVLRHWRSVLAGRADVCWPPQIENLRQLELLTQEGPDREFWQCVFDAATEELGYLGQRRHEWSRSAEFGAADTAVADEVNLFLQRIFSEEPEAMVATQPKPKAKRPANAVGKLKPQPSDAPAPVVASITRAELAGELINLDVDDLHPSPWQTRKPPSQEWLTELGNTLSQEGQLTPCLVRPWPAVEGFQLIAGHTRKVAAKMIGWRWLQCRIVECDDATARRLVLVENAKRQGLDVIEHARALQGLVDSYAEEGKSQRDLAEEIGISQGEISNLVRMLKLPEVWQQRVITGEISKTQARDLLPWCDVAALWPELERAWEDDDDVAFGPLLKESLITVSRPLSGSFFDMTRDRWSKVAFTATTEERAHLDCRTVDGEVRAFNTALWDSMQHVAEDQAAAKSGKQTEATASKVAAKKITPKQAAEQHNKRLYRWKVAWLQKRIAAALEDKTEADTLLLLLVWFAQDGHTASQERRISLAKAFGVRRTSWYQTDAIHILQAVSAKPAAERTDCLRRILQEWVQHPADTGSTDMPASLVDWLAEHLGIDIVRQWSTDRSYLELLTTAQLQELGAEWKLSYPRAMKREPLIEWLLERAKEKPCPKAVRGIKAVSLT